jgi:hypothetical protein
MAVIISRALKDYVELSYDISIFNYKISVNMKEKCRTFPFVLTESMANSSNHHCYAVTRLGKIKSQPPEICAQCYILPRPKVQQQLKQTYSYVPPTVAIYILLTINSIPYFCTTNYFQGQHTEMFYTADFCKTLVKSANSPNC